MLNYKNDFEAVVTRWRSTGRSYWVTTAMISKFEKHAIEEAERAFNSFSLSFKMGGYEKEDVISLAKVYLLNYIGNNSLMYHPDKAEKELAKIKNKTEEGLLNKEIANLHLNIRQRLGDAARLCTLKSQNYYSSQLKKMCFKGPVSSDISDDEFLSSIEFLNYEKVTLKEYRTAKIATKAKNKNFVDNNGVFYKMVYIMPSIHCEISTEPFKNRDALIDLETDLKIEQNIDWYEKLPKEEKIEMLKSFVLENKGNKKLKQELREARRQIKVFYEDAAKNP